MNELCCTSAPGGHPGPLLVHGGPPPAPPAEGRRPSPAEHAGRPARDDVVGHLRHRDLARRRPRPSRDRARHPIDIARAAIAKVDEPLEQPAPDPRDDA